MERKKLDWAKNRMMLIHSNVSNRMILIHSNGSKFFEKHANTLFCFAHGQIDVVWTRVVTVWMRGLFTLTTIFRYLLYDIY